MIDISKKIKDLRLERNLKQKEVASAISIATNTLSQFENNKGRPSLEVLTLLADFFECTVDYLIGREDDFGNITISNASAELPKDEQRLLSAFRTLSDIEKEKLIDDAEFYAKRYSIDSKTKRA